MFASADPRGIAVLVALAGLVVLELLMLWRARSSSRAPILYTCAAYMLLLHAVWIAGLLSSQHFENGFGTLALLTFPWSMLVTVTMTMAGFITLHDLLLNYARFVLGFGGMQCILLTLFVWELKLAPSRTARPGPAPLAGRDPSPLNRR